MAAGGGITGALAHGNSYRPGRVGVGLYFATLSMEETLREVEVAGGQVVYPKAAISDLVGWVAEYEESGGNEIALSER
ncbi:MAG: hypothetical protein H7Y22_15070 [Gemmatimonadaceae bacterium]|nr:hypothetical protein [Gloeobacterales cyanobacterium ES-bin-141]